MSESQTDVLANPILKWLLIGALGLGTGGSFLSVARTQDRFTGSDAARLQSQVGHLERTIVRIEARMDTHFTLHPDKNLQAQISELKIELAKLR